LKAIVRPSVILETLARVEGRKKHVCDSTCKYWRFPHLDRACVLSEVFSVRKGEICTEYQPNRVIEPTSPKTESLLESNAERQRPAGATEDACLHKVAVSEVP